MESSINSSCSSECPTISAEESRLERRRIEEENTAEKKIMETDVADAGTMKLQLPSSHQSFLAEHGKHKTVGVGGDPECIEVCDPECIKLYDLASIGVCRMALSFNEKAFGSSTSLEARTQILNDIIEALADPNTKIIGLLCSNENVMDTATALLQKVTRRADRDKMFDVILKATVTNKPNIKKIQDEIAVGLNLKLHKKSIVGGLNLKLLKKSTAKRASLLHDNIKMRQKIFVILHGLYSGIDLGKVGIPYGADHSGCKILLTSTSQDVLSNQMHTQKNFMV